jgi:hypothetical protein
VLASTSASATSRPSSAPGPRPSTRSGAWRCSPRRRRCWPRRSTSTSRSTG